MDIKELENEINKLKVPRFYFQINETRLNWPALYIHQAENSWTVFYAERGIKEGVRYFDSEHEACVFFYMPQKVLKKVIQFSGTPE